MKTYAFTLWQVNALIRCDANTTWTNFSAHLLAPENIESAWDCYNREGHREYELRDVIASPDGPTALYYERP